MRIWDINPGYLNRQSLLGEHRELHGIVSILTHGKKGYSRHPETMRWVDSTWALRQRHQQLVAEMELRGYSDRSPVSVEFTDNVNRWPGLYIDEPYQQFIILKTKYTDKEPGRIPLPANAQQVWSQHKYSLLARDVELYKKIGKEVSLMKPSQEFSQTALLLTEYLRRQPSLGGVRNALQHMWGHVSDSSIQTEISIETLSLRQLLEEIQKRVMEIREPYLLQSTALSELAVWLPKK